MTDTPISPLTEADPQSLDILFDRVNRKLIDGMPENITDEDLKPIVTKLRAQRKEFLIAQDKLGRAPPAPRKAKPKSVKEIVEATIIDIEDL